MPAEWIPVSERLPERDREIWVRAAIAFGAALQPVEWEDSRLKSAMARAYELADDFLAEYRKRWPDGE